MFHLRKFIMSKNDQVSTVLYFFMFQTIVQLKEVSLQVEQFDNLVHYFRAGQRKL